MFAAFVCNDNTFHIVKTSQVFQEIPYSENSAVLLASWWLMNSYEMQP